MSWLPKLHTRLRDSMMGRSIAEMLWVERYCETAQSFFSYLKVLLGKTAMLLSIKAPVAYSMHVLLQMVFVSDLS